MKNKHLLLVLSLGMLFTSCAKKTNTVSSISDDTNSEEATSEVAKATSEAVDSETAASVEEISSEKESSMESSKKELNATNLYLVGDSTVCSFNDTTYYYPRYGYGTQLSCYLDEKVNVVNYALSGRSTNSFITEANYTSLKENIKAGDYLMIGFGHNDEKSDDSRFASANESTDTEGSFKYNLYNYYIKLAKDAGATPILCTPIARVNTSDDYTGESGHITAYGDYAQAVRDLGTETGTTVIDLTAKTTELYKSIGNKEAINFHAWTTSNSSTVDKTHLNIYGAKNVAYMFATSLKTTSNALADYVKEDISAPTKDDLVVNPSYVERSYEAPDLTKYTAPSMFTCTTEGWYGTAFGDTGGNPNSASSGYFAKEETAGTFTVGQHLDSGSNKGKIGSTEGIAIAFRQVSISKNFKITCDAEVTACANTKQQGFGLMLRDDIYLNLTAADASIKSNYVAAGLYCDASNTYLGYSRVNTALVNKDFVSELYNTGATAKLSIERVGQVITTTVTYNDTSYTNTYTDFDLRAIDNEYMYVGMYGTRGTMVNFTNVAFEITGDAQEA